MEKKLFTIGEISRIKRISKKALRFYEKIGLFRPYYVDPENRYRYYSIEQFVSIDIIKALRIMNISPIAIRAVLKNKDNDEVMEFLDSQKAAAVRTLDELKKTIGSIERIQDMIRNSLDSVSHKGVYIRRIRPRTVVTLPFNNITGVEDAMLEFSKFDRIIEDHRLINTYESGIVFKPRAEGAAPSLIFNTVDIDEKSDASITSDLPGGEYACVCYSKENAAAQSRKISKYCEKKG